MIFQLRPLRVWLTPFNSSQETIHSPSLGIIHRPLWVTSPWSFTGHELHVQHPTDIQNFLFPSQDIGFCDFGNPVVEHLTSSTSKTWNTKCYILLTKNFGFFLFMISGLVIPRNPISWSLWSQNPKCQNPEKSTLNHATLCDFGIFLSPLPIPCHQDSWYAESWNTETLMFRFQGDQQLWFSPWSNG